jgi:cob(I)alamin adenosyltransferase
MKIYTKTGDLGETSLYGGQRLSKGDPRVESIGQLDELQAYLGVIIAEALGGDYIFLPDLRNILTKIQRDIYFILSLIANPKSDADQASAQLEEAVGWLENNIDHLEEQLPELRAFILPAGSLVGAKLHYARTICRRGERSLVNLNKDSNQILVAGLQYLNRLSDFLFVLARFVNLKKEMPEPPAKV